MVHLNKMMKINLYIASAISIALLGGCGGSGSSGANFKEAGNFLGPGNKELDPVNNDGHVVNTIFNTEAAQQNSPAVAIIDFDKTGSLSGNDIVRFNQVSYVSELCALSKCKQPPSTTIPEGLPEESKKILQELYDRDPTLILDVNSDFKRLAGGGTVDFPLGENLPKIIRDDVGLSKIDAEKRDGELYEYAGTVDRRFNGVLTLIEFPLGPTVTNAYLRAPEAAGWSYQTFARYLSTPEDPFFNNRRDLLQGFQSIGDPTKEMPKRKWADYRGIAQAVYDGNQVTMLSNIHADFAKRSLDYNTENATLHTFENGRHIIEERPDLNLTGSASWAKGTPNFSGSIRAKGDEALQGKLQGRFYGPQAAEVGGVFGLSKETDDGHVNYIGGFGAKRN